MSTSYPASVSTLYKVRNKGGRPRRRDLHASSSPGEDERHKDGLAGREEDEGLGGVELDFGGAGAARLDRGQDGWSWSFAAEHRDVKLQLGEPEMLFPRSRQIPPIPALTPRHEPADQLKHVRELGGKYDHLGLDGPVTSELEVLLGSDQAGDADRGGYDPFLGKRTAYVRVEHARITRNLVFFTSGEVGNMLHVAVLLGTSNKHVKNRRLTRFIPLSTPLERFPTEILHICTSSVTSPHRSDHHATALAIRLHASVTMYKASPENDFDPAHPAAPVRLEEMGRLEIADLDGARVVDMVLDSQTWARVALVDQRGGVWLWQSRPGQTKSTGEWDMRLTKIRPAESDTTDPFHRVAFGVRNGTLLVISATEALVIDLDDPDYTAVQLLAVGPGRPFVSIEPRASARLSAHTCLVTSKEVMWVDERRPGPPVLSWKHGLSDGALRDLEIAYLPCEDHDCYVLSSRSNPTITMFHLQSNGDLRSIHPPHSISFPVDSRLRPLASIVFIDQDVERERAGPSSAMIATAKDGSVWTVTMMPEVGMVATPLRTLDGDQVSPVGTEAGVGGSASGETSFTLIDARWAWLAINKDPVPEHGSPAFTPHDFAQYLRELEAPFDHYMTAAELARDSVSTSPAQSRSHILRQLPTPNLAENDVQALSSLDTARDLHLMQAYRTKAQDIDGHLADTATLSSLPEIRQALQSAFPERGDTPATRLRLRRAIDVLAIDLALSSTIVSSEPLPDHRPAPEAAAQTDEDVLARAAGLTLSESGPPPVRFSVLPPRRAGRESGNADPHDLGAGEEDSAPGGAAIQHPTVRSLLAEWPTGSDPAEHAWKPWIITDEEAIDPSFRTKAATRPIRPLPTSRPGSPRLAQLPNTSSSSASQPQPQPPPAPAFYPGRHTFPQLPIVPLVQPYAQTLPPSAGPRSSPPPGAYGGEYSQTVAGTGGWAATQVERGPFGGRGAERKKKVKKHVGGF